MAKLTPEEKLVKQMREAFDNHWFNEQLFAGLMVDENLFYNEQLNKLIEACIYKQAQMYHQMWQNGYTNEGLTRSSYLAEILTNRDNTWYKIKSKLKIK